MSTLKDRMSGGRIPPKPPRSPPEDEGPDATPFRARSLESPWERRERFTRGEAVGFKYRGRGKGNGRKFDCGALPMQSGHVWAVVPPGATPAAYLGRLTKRKVRGAYFNTPVRETHYLVCNKSGAFIAAPARSLRKRVLWFVTARLVVADDGAVSCAVE